MSSKTATAHIFQSGVRNWPASVSRREIEVFNPQARDRRVRRESWRVYSLQGITVTREYRRIQGNTGEYKRIQGNTGKYKGIQENTGKYIREYKEIQRNALGIQVNTGK